MPSTTPDNRPPTRCKTVIAGDVVIKTGRPDIMRIEVAKTRLAHEIGNTTGLFRTARVLDFDKATGTARFERIGNLRRIADVLAFDQDPRDLLVTLGRALARIHAELVLEDDLRIPLPEGPALPGETDVFLHGDFNGVNICIASRRRPPVILDWQMSPRYGERATFGTRYFDLARFVRNMFLCFVFRHWLAHPAGPLAKVFLQSYFAEADCIWSLCEFRDYLMRFMEHEIRGTARPASPLARLLLRPADRRLLAFIESLRL